MGKIAVFTVFKNTNYGAVLQAYALTRVLRRLSGKAVFLIDFIRDQNTNLMYNGIVFHGKHGRKTINTASLKKAVKSLLNYSGTVERTRTFLNFIKRQLPVYPHPFFSGDPISLDGFDCCFLGSDQIWNPDLLKGFHDAYFGITSPRLARVIAYAPSLGKLSFSDREKRELSKKLENVDALSCREEKSCRFLENLTGRHVEQVLDPTMLLPLDEWLNISDAACKLPDKFILVYALKYDGSLLARAMAKARSTGAEVILLGKGLENPPRGILYERAFGPAQFISAISRADCVYTNSFHGTVFSILFKKQFVVQALEEKGQRMENLCGMLGIGNRVFRDIADIPEIGREIDYSSVHGLIDGLRSKSLEYISRNLVQCGENHPQRPPPCVSGAKHDENGSGLFVDGGR